MRGDDQQRWLTARHEAGHAIAALHYGCPLLHVSIVAEGISLGAARIAAPEVPQDAVVLFCGPMAERDWTEFRPGNNIVIETFGSDHAGLLVLQAQFVDLGWWCREALLFLSNPAVQQQTDRLACALLERDMLTADEARQAAVFETPILPGPHA